MMHQCGSARRHRARFRELLQLGLLHRDGLLLEEEQDSPEIEAGLDPHETLAQDHEGRPLQYGVPRQVMRLQAEEVEPLKEEGARREPEAPVEMLVEDNDFSHGRCGSGLGARDPHQHLGCQGQQPVMAERLDMPLTDLAAQPGSLRRGLLRVGAAGHGCGRLELDADEGDEDEEDGLFLSGLREEEGVDAGREGGRMASSEPLHPI